MSSIVPSITTRSPAVRPFVTMTACHAVDRVTRRDARIVRAPARRTRSCGVRRESPHRWERYDRPRRSRVAHAREHLRLEQPAGIAQLGDDLRRPRLGIERPATRVTRPSNSCSGYADEHDGDALTGSTCAETSRARTPPPRRAMIGNRSSPAQRCRCDTRRGHGDVHHFAGLGERTVITFLPLDSTPSSRSRRFTSSSVARACSRAAFTLGRAASAVTTSFCAIARLASRSRTRLGSASAFATAACR